MEKTKLLGLALITTMVSFTACSNDTEEVLAQESEIKLTSEITPSRVASLDYQTTQIVSGQQVGVTITGIKEGQEHNNIPWSVGDNGALTNTGDAVYYGDGAATITAYHPFNDDWDENYTFSVSADQTDAANYLNSDLLWATATSSKTETAVPLIFSHMLAKINVTLVPEKNGDDLNGATISINNTKISTTFNPTTGVISDATGEAQEIIAGVTADDAYTASAIVIPQEVSGKFIKITHEGKTYYYTLASAKTLEAGTSYSFTLTVKGKQLINTGSSINPWNPDSEEGEEGDAEEETTSSYANGVAFVAKAGELSSIIPAEEKNNITSLKISGYLNSDDMLFLKDMAKTTKGGKLAVLDLEQAAIENGKIGSSAFEDCDALTNVILGNSITEIGIEAFEECDNLKDITIGSGVTRIWNNAFLDCPSLTNVYISDLSAWCNIGFLRSNSDEDYDSNPLWGSKLYLNNNLVTELVIPNDITSISTAAFCGLSNITKITIHDNVTSIGGFAFYDCSATNVVIGKGVTSIGSSAFWNSDVTSVVFESETPPTLGSSVFNGGNNLKIYVPETAVDEYKAAASWVNFVNNIFPIE